jgi:hypothetical protein
MASRSPVSITIVRALFAASPNVCAYTGCGEKLTDPAWKEANAEIAHICGERPGAPRFDPAMSVDERNSYDNLMLLCPKHHKLIDRLDPDRHTVEVLREMKAKGELHGSTSRAWATDSELVRFALLLLGSLAIDDSSGVSQTAPRLQVQRSGKQVVMTNVGTDVAMSIVVIDSDVETSPVLLGELPRTLPARARFNIGHWAQTFGSRTFATLTVSWDDEGGNSYVETFPIN